MKTLGIGVDIIENKRIKSLLKNNNFILRTFSKNEIIAAKKFINKANFFAKRFAAKESLVKSIGTGFRNGLNFKDIEILNDKLGQPYFLKSKKIDEVIKKKFKTNKYDLFLSISDEKDYSVAFTILQI
tara:strand:+ start:146 stop:529 length:384 start_codon:yes stop_codon:yes gene_type:complete